MEIKRQTSSAYVEDMSWLQLKEFSSKTKIFLVPYGSISKEHGPHLPLNTDFRQAIGLTDILAEELNKQGIDFLITPAIGFGYYPAFELYPGTIHLDKNLATQLVINYCKAYESICKKFYFVNTGISTIPILQDAKEELQKINIAMDFFNYREFDKHFFAKSPKKEQGTHAGLYETSLMLALVPECVDMEKAVDNDVPDAPGPLYPSYNPPPNDPAQPGVLSDSGVWGAPTKASKKIGEEMISEFCLFALPKVGALISLNPSDKSMLSSLKDAKLEINKKKRKLGENQDIGKNSAFSSLGLFSKDLQKTPANSNSPDLGREKNSLP